jgi:parallel beta-helix repeat protein
MSCTRCSPTGKRNVRAPGRARPPALSPRLEALEDRTLLATIFVGPTRPITTIQGGVTAAAAGDTVSVDPATYTEQVTIKKSLTLQGNGAGVIIQAPTMLMSDNGQSSLVEIFGMGLTVNINNLTIQGPNPTITAGIFIAGGATANVTGTTVNQINQGAANFGVQGVRGILVGSSAGGPGNATIMDCLVTNYQKTGIVTGGTGTTVNITGTTVTGVGSLSPLASVTAQNGIQISAGTTAQVSNNSVSGNEFTGPGSGPDPTMNTQSVGIFNFSDGSSFTGNTVFGNDEGIFSSNTGSPPTTISGNTVENNRFQGIILSDGAATVSNNTITGNNIGVAVRASGNGAPPVNAQGTLISNNITNNGNVGVGFPGGGIVLLKVTGATGTPVVTAHFNRIVGNSVGLNNSRVAMAATVDATNNFWGSNAGPGGLGSDTVSGPATFNPWLVLQVTASPDTLLEGEVATVVADLTMNNAGMDTAALGQLPDGIPVSFAATDGTIVPAAGFTAEGQAAAQFTAGTTAGAATVSATVDNQTSTTALTVIRPVPSPLPTATVGVFDPATQTWYLRGSNSAGPPAAGQFRFGTATSLPVSGDWTGITADTIGVFDQNTFTWFLRNEDSAGPPDAGQFQYGALGWLPVTGDWQNSGHTGIGAFDPSTQTWFLRNEPNAGAPDAGQFRYGVAGGIPVVGDWTGTGHLGIGVFDPATFTWYLRSSATAGPPDVGVFHFGGVGFKPVAGDWTGAGHAGIGAFDPGTATWYLRTEPTAGAPDAGQFAYGGAGWLPVAGAFAPGGAGGGPLAAEQLNAIVTALLAWQKHDRP